MWINEAINLSQLQWKRKNLSIFIFSSDSFFFCSLVSLPWCWQIMRLLVILVQDFCIRMRYLCVCVCVCVWLLCLGVWIVCGLMPLSEARATEHVCSAHVNTCTDAWGCWNLFYWLGGVITWNRMINYALFCFVVASVTTQVPSSELPRSLKNTERWFLHVKMKASGEHTLLVRVHNRIYVLFYSN